jgi:hypothetical protein
MHVRSRSLRAWLTRCAVALASLAVSLVVAELAVGRFLPVGGVVYRLDPELLLDALPNARRIQAMPPAAVREGDAARVWIATNSLGLRGPELETPKVRPRLLVLGDSYVMAENVPHAATFVHRLQLELETRLVAATARERGGEDARVRLGERAPGIECVNAGRSGYGPDQALLLARRLVEDVEPDALLIVLCSANDLGDLARNKLFALGPGGGLESRRPRVAPHVVRDFERRAALAARPALVRLLGFARERRGAAAWPPAEDTSLLPLYDELLYGQFDDHFVRGDPTVNWLFEDIYDSVQALAPEGVVAQRELALLTAVLRALGALAEARGIPCAAVITPAAPDLVPGLLVRITPESHPGYRRGTLPRLHREAATAAGLRVVDVSDELAAYHDPSALFVGGDDPHWNAAGQALAARVVAGELAEWADWARRR